MGQLSQVEKVCFIGKIGRDNALRVGKQLLEEGKSLRTVTPFATVGHMSLFSFSL